MKAIQSLLFSFLWCVVSGLYAGSSPVPMLENAAQQIISTLKTNQGHLKQNQHVIHQAVRSYLLPHVDVIGMSRSVLGREVWLKASANEKQQFSQAFTQLVIRTYARPLAEYNGETIKFSPVRGSLASRFLRVNSVILRPSGQSIPLGYSLVASGEGWKIYDLSVEGVSLLQSFRSQFAAALHNSSIQEIIKQMQQKSQKASS